MSRTRQKHNELDLWLFPKSTIDTSGHIENVEGRIGIHFNAEDMGMKTRTEKDILSGRYYQSGTSNVYRTNNQIEFNIGDNIATTSSPRNSDLSSIIKITSKPQNKRGARHNTARVIEYTIEVS